MKSILKRLTASVIFVLMAFFSVQGIRGAQFFTSFASYEEVLESGYKLNEEIAEEGFVLLKNDLLEDGTAALPLKNNAKISTFGKSTVSPVYGGSGSGQGSSANRTDFYQSLDNAGINYNKVLKNFYLNNSLSGVGRPSSPSMGAYPIGFATGETPVENYLPGITASYNSYLDAAVVMLSRIGGEGYDLPTSSWQTYNAETGTGTPIAGVADGNNHYLELAQVEKDLLQHIIDSGFENIILVINSSNTMELGFIEDMPEIKAALWIGGPGATGLAALGRILTGEVNPSGRLVDIHTADFTKDPAYQNFAKNGVYGDTTGNAYYLQGADDAEGNPVYNAQGFHTLDYEEGIYLGYRYYETRAYEMTQNGLEGEDWYKDSVVYPFAYGLSYTTFTQEIVDSTPAANSTLSKDGKISIDVKVTNTGEVAGKEVVQLYYTAPYYSGGIEKSYVSLVEFGKTKLLKPGQSQVVTIEFDVRDMASYDYNDANDNGRKGVYELEAGEYEVKLMKDSHTVLDSVKYNVTEVAGANGPGKTGFIYDTDSATGNPIDNRFDDVSFGVINDAGTAENGLSISEKVMTRADFGNANIASFPTTPSIQDRVAEEGYLDDFNAVPAANGNYDFNQPWAKLYATTNDFPLYQMTQLTAPEITLYDLIGVPYDDNLYAEGSDKTNKQMWEAYLDQFTLAQYAAVVGTGYYTIGGGTLLEALGIVQTASPDGPSGFASGVNFCAEIVIASTFNKDLAYKMGNHMGEEALWTNSAGWYAPAMNIHRTPFSGRNFEYYSEDPVLSGIFGAATTKGASDKGMVCFIKHFALNDQETNRDGLGCVSTWADEQTIREIYLKPFEYSVKDGNSLGVMSSFNRLGKIWAGRSYALLTEILRDEWGFKGCVVTDYFMGGWGASSMNTNTMVRAGNDLSLGSATPDVITVPAGYNDLTDQEKSYYSTHVYSIRNSAFHVTYALAHSLGMRNGIKQLSSVPIDLGTRDSGTNANFNLANLIDLEGDSFSYYQVAAGSQLPTGLSLSSAGALTGRLTNASLGENNFIVEVLADGYISRFANVKLTVDGAIYDKPTNVTAYKGLDFEIDLSPVRYSTGVAIEGATYASNIAEIAWGTWVIVPGFDGGLPAWLSLSGVPANGGYTANNILSGVPTAVGSYEFVIRINVGSNRTFDQAFVVNVVEPGSFLYENQTAPSIVVGNQVNIDIKVPGVANATYAVKENTELPTGLELNPNGTVTGTPAAGTHKFVIVAKAAGFADAEAEFTVVVNSLGTFDYANLTLPGVYVNNGYSASVATASIANATYELKSGSNLPAGLVLAPNGQLIGTPTTAGTYTFTVVASADGYEDKEAVISILVSNVEVAPEPEPSNDTPMGLGVATIIIASVALVAVAGAFIILLRKK